MARLNIRLLGSFQVQVDGEIITCFESNKVRALLAILAADYDHPHPRTALAGMLWPQLPERVARQNLSQALSNLRNVIRDRDTNKPSLSVTYEDLRINPQGEAWIDLQGLDQLITQYKEHPHQQLNSCQSCLDALHQASNLIRGEFLAGFPADLSSEFQHWFLVIREMYHRKSIELLQALVNAHYERGDYKIALDHAWKLLSLDRWREDTHRHLIRLLALTGQRSAALAQYETCCQVLAEAFGIEPGAETMSIVEQVRSGDILGLEMSRIPTPVLEAPLPSFLDSDSHEAYQSPVFVGRGLILDSLSETLAKAVSGDGRVVFIQGSAGEGKTALLHEFARWAMASHPDLLVAFGGCNAFSGAGDPYLPFRDILGILTGDVEAIWTAGQITRDHARRLWENMPGAVELMAHHAPFLVDTLVPGRELISRSRLAVTENPGWLLEIQMLHQRESQRPTDLDQVSLLEQTTNFLREFAKLHPLLLIIDDAQWIDSASTNLLFHLGRNLEDVPILLLGAFRPEEVIQKRNQQHHPLELALREFQYRYGEGWIDLVQIDHQEGRDFSDLLLDTQPNELDESFRQLFYQRTGGQALFTVELLRAMQENGDLVKNQEGKWVTGPALNWNQLPRRVEAVIAARVDRLGEEFKEILSVASVVGESFIAQVVAFILDIPARDIMKALSQEIETKHHLVRESGTTRIDGHMITSYAFAHSMFHTYLYDSLGDGERLHLHGEVARALEYIFQRQIDEVMPQLAFHYAHSGDFPKALEFSLLAGERAFKTLAYHEAADYFNQAVNFLVNLPDGDQKQSWQYKAVEGLGYTHYALGDTTRAEKYLREAIQLGLEIKIPAISLARVYYRLCENLFWQGRYIDTIALANHALEHLPKDTESIWPLLMEAMIGLGELNTFGKIDKYRQYAYKIRPLLPQLPLVEELNAIYSHVFEVLTLDRNEAGALEVLQDLGERAKSIHNIRMLARADWNHGIFHYLEGNLQESIECSQEGYTQFDRVGDAKHECLCLFWLGKAMLSRGELSESEKVAQSMLRRTETIDLKWTTGLANSLLGQVYLAQKLPSQAIEKLQRVYETSKTTGNSNLVWVSYLLGRANESAGYRSKAIRLYQEGARLEKPEDFFLPFFVLPFMLYSLEQISKETDAFKVFCDRLLIGDPKASSWIRSNWYLVPSPRPEDFEPVYREAFQDVLSDGWTWLDPYNDCSYSLDDGLVLYAANARDLWFLNMSAPRLLRARGLMTPNGGAVETICSPGPVSPTIGGLILWKDKDNYLLLDRGYCGEYEVNFRGYLDGQPTFIGRGSLPGQTSDRVFLRLSWHDGRIQAICSEDGENWYSVGEIPLSLDGKWKVGLNAIGNIERAIYQGAYPDGSSIRFESFKIWAV